MAGKHEEIVTKVILDWTRNGRGRLYKMRQGTATPLNSRTPIWFGPLDRKFKGFSDLFGFEYEDCMNLPIFTVVEVKTKTDKVRPAQERFLNYIKSIGGNAYVARESDEGYNIEPW